MVDPHVQRVIQEKSELDDKIEKLSIFIGTSPIYQKLDEIEKTDLCKQSVFMQGYSEILGSRLSRMDTEGADEPLPDYIGVSSQVVTGCSNCTPYGKD